MRTPVAEQLQADEKLQSWPAPVGGWIANTSLATPGARLPDGRKVNGAARLENWFPTATAIRMRGGSEKYATVGNESDDVVALFSYINGSTEEFFAADEVAIYDITTVADPEVSPSEAVGSLSNITVSVVQFTAADGTTYLRVVNGANTPLVYDGSSWGTSPAITGSGLNPANLSIVWQFKNRLFFVERDTMNAWYLSVDSIGGSATKLPLGGVFTRGGYLLFGASWSLDENSGLTASCAFFSSEGEVAVYKGANPSDADDWVLSGVYRIGKPMGPEAFIRAGGDLVIATDIGFIPLSVAVSREFAAIQPSAVSYPIEDAWNEAVQERSAGKWHCEIWPDKQMVVVALHGDTDVDGVMYVANARTGAWAPFTGWNGKCVHVFGDRCFYGSTEGRVIECEVTGADEGDPYTAVSVPLFDPLKTPASIKTGLLARVVLRATYQVTDRLSLQSDYTIDLPNAPDVASPPAGPVWGTGKWGEAVWGTEPERQTFKRWRPVNGTGESLSVACQITSGGVSAPAVDLIQTDLTYEIGEVGG